MRANEFLNAPMLGMGQLRFLTEAPARLSRLQSHAQSRPFIMISASRGDLSVRENKTRSTELVQILRSHGLGGIQIEGHWLEAGRGSVTELSFFVPLTKTATINGHPMDGDTMLAFACELGKQFQQEALLYGDGTWVYEVDCQTGNFEVRSSTAGITQQELGAQYSRIQNRNFKFAEKPLSEYRMLGYRVPNTYLGAEAMASMGLWPDF